MGKINTLDLIDKLESIQYRLSGVESLYFGSFLNNKNVEQELISTLFRSVNVEIKEIVSEIEQTR